MSKKSQILLYVMTFFISFSIFLLWVFPLDLILQHYLAEESRKLSQAGEWNFKTGHIDANVLTRSVVHDLVVVRGGREVFTVPRFDMSVALIPLLSGQIHSRFSAHLQSGRVDGRLVLDQSSECELELQRVGVDQFANVFKLMSDHVSLSPLGELNGSFYYSWSADGREREGDIKLKWSQARVSDLKLGIGPVSVGFDELTLTPDDQPAEINLVIDNTQIAVSKFKLYGPDLGLEVSGNMRMNRQNQIVRYMLDGVVTLGDPVMAKIPDLFKGTLQQQKRPDGGVPVALKGSARKPELKVGELSFPLNFDATADVAESAEGKLPENEVVGEPVK